MEKWTLELANWGGLLYFMVEEVDPSRLLVRVLSQKGSIGVFDFETTGIVSNELDPQELSDARTMIRENRDVFLDYWNETKKSLNIT